MDQKTIMEGLSRALAQGSGDLNDLENLLKRVQQDIEKAKAEAAEEEAKRKALAEAEEARKRAEAKRGQKIAQFANRLLDNKPTADDVAFVLETYLKSQGINIHVTGDAVEAGIKASNAIDDSINDFIKWFGDFFEPNDNSKDKPAADATPDEKIDRFLRNMGLR